MFFSIPAMILKVVGENYTDIDNIIQDNGKYLIGYAYDESNYKYIKHKELKYRESQTIVALGSSRVLQFREHMFSCSFYNAGYTISSITDFIPFINANFKSKSPKILLIALDQWMFNENWDNLSEYNVKKEWKAPSVYRASVATLSNVWADLLNDKYGLEVLTQRENNGIRKIGLNAVVNNYGFRKDGSIYYGGQITKLLNNDSTANDFNYSDTYDRISSGNRRFEYGRQVNKKSLIVLNDLLAFCKKHNIYVVAIIPPFANGVNKRMFTSNNYKYMEDIYIKSNNIFKKNGFELWDMTNLNKYGSNDQETIDGFHGGEVSYLRMLIYMIENGSVLKKFTDIQKLKSDLNNRKNAYIIYEN